MKATILRKALFLSLITAVLFLMSTVLTQAASVPAKATDKIASPGPSAAARNDTAEKAEKDKADAQEKMRKLVQQAKDKLNNTSWQIDFRSALAAPIDQKPTKGKKALASALEKDTISFKDNKIESASLAPSGFTPTNYTVRLKGKDNEITIWETMQTSLDKGVAFWRGEIENDVMRGVLSWQLDEQNKQDYSFTSAKKEVVAPTPAVTAPTATIPAVAAPAPAVTAPVITTPAVTTPVAKPAPAQVAAPKPAEPKKKGWWGK